MVCSMTGYGSSRGIFGGTEFSIEIRALNHRYLDIHFRMPREIQKYEDRLRAAIKKKITRGRLDVSVAVDTLSGDTYSIRVNYPLATAYREALTNLRSVFSFPDDISLGQFIRVPDLFVIDNRFGSEEDIVFSLEKTLEATLDDLISRRRYEGENLKNDLLCRCETVENEIEKIKEQLPMVMEKYRQKLREKIKALEGGCMEESRLLTECAIFAERSDVSEEIVRLGSHLQAMREILSAHIAEGKKIDFILQEMFREINTIGAKSSDYNLASHVINLKTELEKMREQAQNIE